jgi:hypothetical protein
MKISKKQLKRIIKEEKQKLLREMNADGTISDDEDEQREDLLAHVEITINELIQYVLTEADRIGGGYRSPGIRAQALKIMAEKIHKVR